jgi:hypothetical protein
MKGQNMRECEVCRRRSGNDRCCQILQVKSARISFSPARGRTREEMASKGGTRAAGTDGNDFQYRQRVDSKYQKAAVARKKVKNALSALLVYHPVMAAWAVLPSVLTGADLDEYNVPFSSLAFVGFCLALTTMSMVGSNKTIQPENLESMCAAVRAAGALNLIAGFLMRLQVDDKNLLMRRFTNLVAREIPGVKDSPALAPAASLVEALLMCVGLLLALAVYKHGKALASYTKTR